MEQLLASGWPLTVPVMVGVPTAMMRKIIITHPVTALAAQIVFVATRALTIVLVHHC